MQRKDKYYDRRAARFCRRNGMRLHSDVPYAIRGQKELHLQIISHNDGSPRPTVVFVPGSAWHKQTSLHKMALTMAPFAARGFNLAIVEYRCTEEGGVFPAQTEDAKTAVRFMRAHSDEYGVDRSNIFIWGDSSGGHTALCAGFCGAYPEFDTDDYPDVSSAVNAVADYYGPTDITCSKDFPASGATGAANTPEGMLIGGFDVPQNLDKAAPTLVSNFIGRDIPPVIIIHGDSDRIVNIHQSDLLYSALTAANKVCEYHIIKGADHGAPPFWKKKSFSLVEKFFRAFIKETDITEKGEKAMKILVVVDMQNDFIDGALGTAEAVAIVPNVAEKIKGFDGKVIFTRDTHEADYLTTQEGRNLPVEHCIRGTEGWEICPQLRELCTDAPIDKPTFGSTALGEKLAEINAETPIESITFVGLCTDICVISNAMIAKAALPEVPVIVDAACCAGVTPASHTQALGAMKMCQIAIENE